MQDDPIVAEVRRVREAHAAKFNYDLDLIFQDIKAKEQSNGRRYVRYPPRPCRPTNKTTSTNRAEKWVDHPGGKGSVSKHLKNCMFKPVDVKRLPGYKLHIRYADGVEGEVDLSHLVGKGVFAIWNDPKAFENVSIGESGDIRWGDQVDLCPDALYLQIIGKSPEDVFPSL